METEQLLDEALPDEGNSEIADRVPHGHALDAHRDSVARAQRLQSRGIGRELVLLVVVPDVGQSSPASAERAMPASAIRPARLRAWNAPREKPMR